MIRQKDDLPVSLSPSLFLTSEKADLREYPEVLSSSGNPNEVLKKPGHWVGDIRLVGFCIILELSMPLYEPVKIFKNQKRLHEAPRG